MRSANLGRAAVVSPLWRISNHADLEGLGGERGEGRWHTAERGRRIVYLSENAATALIETLANLKGNPNLFPDTCQLLRIGVPASVPVSSITTAMLSSGWREHPAETRALGDAWLSARSSALLRVPSVPAPESTNFLLNPLHPDAQHLTIESVQRIAYDKRLFHVYPAL